MPTLVGAGLFVVKGVHGALSFVGGAVTIDTTKSKINSAGYSQTHDVAIFRDGLGAAKTAVAGQETETISIDFTVHSETSSGSLALAKSNPRLPDVLSVVALSGFGNTDHMDGNWHYLGDGSIDYSDNFVTLRMTLGRFGGAVLTPDASAFNT